MGIYGVLDAMPKGRNETGPYHSLTDWARPRNMYGEGEPVEANRPVSCSRLWMLSACSRISRRTFLAFAAPLTVGGTSMLGGSLWIWD
jgi:hypothetical protein